MPSPDGRRQLTHQPSEVVLVDIVLTEVLQGSHEELVEPVESMPG